MNLTVAVQGCWNKRNRPWLKRTKRVPGLDGRSLSPQDTFKLTESVNTPERVRDSPREHSAHEAFTLPARNNEHREASPRLVTSLHANTVHHLPQATLEPLLSVHTASTVCFRV